MSQKAGSLYLRPALLPGSPWASRLIVNVPHPGTYDADADCGIAWANPDDHDQPLDHDTGFDFEFGFFYNVWNVMMSNMDFSFVGGAGVEFWIVDKNGNDIGQVGGGISDSYAAGFFNQIVQFVYPGAFSTIGQINSGNGLRVKVITQNPPVPPIIVPAQLICYGNFGP